MILLSLILHILLGIKKLRRMNIDMLFTFRTNTNSANSYSSHIIICLVDVP